jgi:mannose-1-phosphate guanylyltransferase/mannose-6-phosphate isomerase
MGQRYAVVVAGGSGTRLWPLSRRHLPKQMQPLMSDRTLIAETVDRLRGVVPPENVFISTTDNYRQMISDQLPDIDAANFIVEPEARGTAAAFALLANHIYRLDPEAVVFSLASDHAITDIDRFQQTMLRAYELIEREPQFVAIVGIRPTRPDTGLGYIKGRRVDATDENVFRAEKFVEKPTREVAQGYLDSGEYFWNSAYYCFRVSTLLKAYDDADPSLVRATAEYLDTHDPAAYRRAPTKVHEMEIIDSTKFPLAVIAAEFQWSDIGTWVALHRALSERGGTDLVSKGRHRDLGSSHCLVLNDDDRVVVTVGLNNVAVIATSEEVLVFDMLRLEENAEAMQSFVARLQGQTDGGDDA